MAFNAYGSTPLKKTGISALTDIYKKKTEPNTWAGGSYGRGYAQRMYGMDPSAFGYANGSVTINGNPIYKAQNVNGKAMINDSQIPDYQKAIDTYAKNTGFVTPDYNPNTDNIYQLFKRENEQAGDALARRTTASTMANLSSMTGGMPNSWGVGAATQAGAAAAEPFYQRTTEMLPVFEKNFYDRQQANKEWLANQQQQKFANDTTIAGLTGMYNGKPTADQANWNKTFNADQVYRDKTFAAEQSNADRNYRLSASNAAADNARANRSLDWQMDLVNNPDNVYKIAQINASQNKTNYKTDPDFADDLMSLNKDKSGFHDYLMNHVQEVIAKYGYDGFSELYNKSKPTSNNTYYDMMASAIMGANNGQ